MIGIMPPLHAACHLGITPELLFSYTRERFRKAPGQTRRLATVQRAGATWFDHAELDDFDRYLREPWAEAGAKRVAPPRCVLDHLRAESGNQCVRCGTGIGVETAHIEPWATSRSNHHNNLLRICSQCHDEHDIHNSLPTDELRALKARVVERTRARLRQGAAPAARTSSPGPDAGFRGRAREVREVREALQASRAVLIRGPGGIGKTQLLLQALAGVGTGRTVLWVEVERYGSAEDVLLALEVAVSNSLAPPGAEGLAGRLDGLRACVILDGVERLRGPSLDALDDLLLDLLARTAASQFVVTSQVDLQRPRFDEVFDVGGLPIESGRELFRSLLRGSVALDDPSERELLAFAGGHPLAVRLASMLANHFGSTRSALERVERHGVETLEVQKRASQDRGTSLRVCLSLAYEALEPEERRLLYLVSNCPGGVFSALVAVECLGLSDARAAIAGARRWSLVQAREAGGGSERLSMLSPIAAYVDRRWRADHPHLARDLANDLLVQLGLFACVLDRRADDAAEVPYVLGRLAEELPNLLRILDAAEAQPDHRVLGLHARGLCTALMRFFFILRQVDLGCRVMLRGARIALREGLVDRAGDILVQLVALARRGGEQDAEAVRGLLAEVEAAAVGAGTRGNVELARAMMACHVDARDAERHAREAVTLFGAARDERAALAPGRADDPGRHGIEEAENSLAHAYGTLGDALLAQRRFAEAASVYRTSLSWLRGNQVAVNEGQWLHQIGNCESELGRHDEAARCYGAAATRFLSLGMREYLGNALGELGLTVLAAGDSVMLPDAPPFAVLAEGLDDVSSDIACVFSRPPYDRRACAGAIRKLFGLFVLASLSIGAAHLGPFAAELRDQVVGPAAAPCERDGTGEDAFLLNCLDRLGALAFGVASVELRAREAGGLAHEDVEALAKACFRQGPVANVRNLSFDWLALYLRRRWSLGHMTADALRDASLLAARGYPFRSAGPPGGAQRTPDSTSGS